MEPSSASSETPGDRPSGPVYPNLALIRTDLANERTLLAYGRTSLMLVATGVSLVKFLNLSFDLVLIGWGLIAIGAVVGLIGMIRFTSLKRRLGAVREA